MYFRNEMNHFPAVHKVLHSSKMKFPPAFSEELNTVSLSSGDLWFENIHVRGHSSWFKGMEISGC